jgi:endonuclease/exonuclease/phosphatase family metal-dependent hydrolase
MNIISWNILANEFISKKYYPMIPPEILFDRKHRQECIIKTLKRAAADVMLLQEVMQAEYNILANEFQREYHLIKGKYIRWQNIKGYSGNVILLRRDMFSLDEITQLKFGLYVKCKFKKIPLTIANVHLDDVSENKRIKAIETILPDISISRAISIIGGDFNEEYKKSNPSPLYKLFKDYTITNTKPSYYIEKKECIDNIIVKGLTIKQQQVLNEYGNDVIQHFYNYGSDHLPVIVTIQ